jgi:hypothetical protein
MMIEYVFERGLLPNSDALSRSEVIRRWSPFRVVRRSDEVDEARRFALQREYGDPCVFKTVRSFVLEDHAYRALEQRKDKHGNYRLDR